MTREEAKDYIREWCPYDRQEEIIKALEQEPCEDAIRREDAINAVSEALEHVFVEHEDIAKKMINKLPSVNPQPKTGHWIFQKITQGKRMWCSHCNSAFDLCCSQIKRYNEATRDDDIWAYCPWCGARMVEPQKRSDKE